jgi:hypothetical protein
MRYLYKLLNIPNEVIINYNLDLDDGDLNHLNNSVAIINKFHSYFHFEQSFLYLIAAYINYLMSNKQEQEYFLEKAIFQDHLNIQALNFNTYHDDINKLFSYDKNHEFLNNDAIRCLKF